MIGSEYITKKNTIVVKPSCDAHLPPLRRATQPWTRAHPNLCLFL